MPRRMQFRDQCAACGKQAEPISAYSLIGDGWRLSTAVMEDGREVMQWHCPECRRQNGGSSGTMKVADRKT
jgi:hypothetical protein